MYAVRLTRIESTHQNLRTGFVDGFCDHLPFLETAFQMWAQPLDQSKTVRHIATSPIQLFVECWTKNRCVFKTLNSVYELELLEGYTDVVCNQRQPWQGTLDQC